MVRAAATIESTEVEPTLDFDEMVLLPMPKRTYRLLADAAYRRGKPMNVFVQELFDHFIAEAMKG